MILIRRLPAIVLLMLFTFLTKAQVSSAYLKHNAYLDSLVEQRDFSSTIEYTLTTPPEDDATEILFTIQRNRAYLKHRQRNPEILRECLNAHKQLITKKDSLSRYFDGRILELLGHYFYQESNLFMGLSYLDSAALAYQSINAHERTIYNWNMIGTIYYLNGERSKSARFYLQALDQFNRHPIDSIYYLDLLMDLGNLHSDLEQYRLAKEYYNRIYKDPVSAHYPQLQANAFLNLGNLAQNENKDTEASFFYKKAISAYTELEDSGYLAIALHNLAALKEDSLADEAMELYQQSIDIKKKYGDLDGLASSTYSLALIQWKNHQNEIATANAFKALDYSLASTHYTNLAEIYKLLGYIEAENKHWEKAYEYNQRYQNIADSLALLSQQEAINRLEQNYDLEQQKQLFRDIEEKSKLNASKLKKSKIINYALGGASVLLIVVLVLLMSNFQQIQRTKNTLFRRNLEITSAEALINGQEQERQRLAHQLHDKVGNYITVLKNHIVTLDVKDTELLKIVQDMSGEVRNISQDLMPPVLERFGLADALEELCTRYRDQTEATIDLNIDQSKVIPLSNEDQINLYRLVQEIIQFSLFQYNSNYLLIDMSWNNEGIWVSIEDNGTRKPRISEETIMMHSWKTIEHRVQFLKGEMKRSNHNQGNEYKVHIPILQ